MKKDGTEEWDLTEHADLGGFLERSLLNFETEIRERMDMVGFWNSEIEALEHKKKRYEGIILQQKAIVQSLRMLLEAPSGKP